MTFRITVFLFMIIAVEACHLKSNKEGEQKKELDFLQSVNHSTYNPVLLTEHLPAEIDEQSGLVWYNDLFWTHNDSGSEPKLYAYSSSGELKQEIEISNAKNYDWEDVTDDSDYLFVGDFGNNYGDRKNLLVLKLAKKQLNTGEENRLLADKIKIEWADQTDFSLGKHKHNFDCEAFFAYGDSLYFFSKNWGNQKTRMYTSSKEPGSYSLQPKAQYDVNFLVTGADISSDGKLVALIGYKNYRSHLILFYDFTKTDFFGGKSLNVDLSPMDSVQTEAIVFGENDSLYISTEKTKKPHSLFKLEWRKWMIK